MRVVVLALALTLVAGQHPNLAPTFVPGSTYEYDYQAKIMGGLSEQRLASAGLKLHSRVKISVDQQTEHGAVLLLQLDSPQVFEHSGVWQKDTFSQTQLRADLEAHLRTPIKFKYQNGIVGDLLAPQSVPTMVLNIHRGILNIFQLTIKQRQNDYELQEEGAQGVCKTHYVITEKAETGHIHLVKSRDLNQCQEKVRRDIGLAYTRTCHHCQKVSTNLRDISGYEYKLKQVPNGHIIEEASVRENIQFSPFNELNGAATMETKQHLKFLQIKQARIAPANSEYSNRGSLKYEFSTELMQSPIRIFKMSDTQEQIEGILRHLVADNRDIVHEDAPLKFLELIQLLRQTDLSGLRTRLNAQGPERKWVVDAFPYIGTEAALELAMEEIQKPKQHVSEAMEASQILIGVLHMLEPSRQNVDKVLSYIKTQQEPEGLYKQVVRKSLLLSYGGLIHRHCERAECKENLIQPIQQLLEGALTAKNTEELVLLAKVLANAAHPWTIKSITKLLPIHGTKGHTLSKRVHIEAILALRSLAKLKLKEVQILAMQLYMDTTLDPELRTLAVITLFETKPSVATVTNVAKLIKSDQSEAVSSFTYSLIKSLSRSTDHSVAAVANVGLRILGQRKQNMKLSKAFLQDYYSHPLTLGAAASIYSINDAATILPKTAIAKTTAFFAGAAADLIEIGVRSEGFQEHFLKREVSDSAEQSAKMKRILKALHSWKSMPTSQMLGSAYIKVLGQNVAFVDIDKQVIEQAIQMSSELGMTNMQTLQNLVQNGVSAHWAKAMMPAEIRRIMPTAAGLPMELALYTVAVTVADVQVKFTTSLDKNFQLQDILRQKNSEIQTQIKPSIALNTFAVMGVNSDIAQVAMVSRAKAKIHVPSEIHATLDFVDKNFKIKALPVALPENVAATVEVETVAIARRAKKTTPLIPEVISSHSSRSSSASSTDSQDVQDNRQVQDRTASNSRTPRNDKKYCIKSAGVKSCLRIASHNAKFLQDSALYRLAGKHLVRLSLHQSETEVVEKYEVELQIGAKGAEKIQKPINLNMEDIPEGTPILSKLKRFLAPGLKSNRTSSSSSSSSSASHSSRSSRSSHSEMGKKIISAVGRIMGTKHRSSSSSSSSSNRSHNQKNKSTVSNLSSMFSYSSSSGSQGSQRPSSQIKFQPIHHKRTPKTHSGSASSGATIEDIRNKKKFLGDSVPTSFVLIFRAVTDNKNKSPMGYQIAAYEDQSESRVQMVITTLDHQSNWRLSADAATLSQNKVAAKVSWGEPSKIYDALITAESGLVEQKMAARVRLAWKRLPTAVVKNVQRIFRIYSCSVSSYLSSFKKQRRSENTKQISFTVVAESKKQLNIILKSVKSVYSHTVTLPMSVPLENLRQMAPYENVKDNIHYLLAKSTGAQCKVENGQIRSFNDKSHRSPSSTSCYQLLAQECTDNVRFAVLMKKDPRNNNMVNVKIDSKDYDMTIENNVPVVTLNGEKIQRLPYQTDKTQIKQEGNKLFLHAPEYDITELTFSKDQIEIDIPDHLRNKVCGLCGPANGDQKSDYRMPSGRRSDDSISFAHSWTLPSQSCSDESGCRLTHENVELNRDITIQGVRSKCLSVDPVLRCRQGCYATRTAQSKVGFNCRPFGFTANDREGIIDMTETVEAHLDCTCTPQCA
uniref:Vitellogenin A n=1 Tax=Pomatoschistus minutus TaxID=13225 RepID=S4VFU0_POMMI|nr:vitellogenin A [Pomatoschistus minutus]